MKGHDVCLCMQWWAGELERPLVLFRGRRHFEARRGSSSGEVLLDSVSMAIRFVIEEMSEELFRELLAGFHR